MHRFVAIVLSLSYAFQALLGHAGLHYVAGHEHSVSTVSPDETVRIVQCFHAPGDKTPCNHSHHCAHHSTQDERANDEHDHHPDHHEHDQDDCQICHHLAHSAIPTIAYVSVLLSEMIVTLDTPQERYYHAVIVALPLSRGPPVCFA